VIRRFLVVLTLLFLSSGLVWAQTPTPAPAPTLPGYAIQLSAGYSYISNAPTNNGFFSSLDVPMWHDPSNKFAISGSGSYFTMSTPSSYFAGGGPVAHFQYSNKNLLNGQVFQPFVGADFGVTRSIDTSTGLSTGSTHFGVGIKGGLDTVLTGNVSWRVFQVEWIHSTLYPGNSVTISNIGQISTGLNIRF
jgi:hypothetical protein